MELSQALTEVRELRDELHNTQKWGDPNYLSEIVVRLAVYGTYVGDGIAAAHKAATDEAGRSYYAARKRKESATAAGDISRFESTESREFYENLKYFQKAIETLLTTVQTRLRTLESQAKNRM
jgi:aldehyde:ferredoxin oxidoreductase